MAFDPYAPYGPLVESTLRVVTWNVWGRHGPEWEQRQSGIEDVLTGVGPDVVCLVEAWAKDGKSQTEHLARRLGFDHYLFMSDWEVEDWLSGSGMVSRWPLKDAIFRPLKTPDGSGFGNVLHAIVDGERGPIQLFVAMLDYPLDGSAIRQGQVKDLARFIQEKSSNRYPIVVCGDFNAGPDSEEIRMLTGRSPTAAPGLVFYDAWEVAGDGTPGHTWSNLNPLAAIGLYPNRRFDYVFSAWPRRGGAGHPVRCELLGVRSPAELQLSDHYGVVADLRY
ncbi:MAG TPA: endonuclease/exonuclease/phosphatase family protein [Acidimicrobiales bacterium]|nr:endonuclease/exonuclease/phosphatase family protein [Acidimicrobiales bacterium]